MEKYISKFALVAEIESLLDKGRYHEEYDCAYRDGNNGALYALKNKLNTLEVKEADIKKEIKDYFDNQPIITRSKGVDYQLIPSREDVAKHFFELGLKAQKEFENEDIINFHKTCEWIRKEYGEEAVFNFCKAIDE